MPAMPVYRIKARRFTKAALAVGLASAAPQWAAGQALADECKTLWKSFMAAAKAGDLKRAAAGERAIFTDPICNASLAVPAKQAMLDLYRRQDARLEREGAPPARRLAQLTAALRYSNDWNTWDIQARIGDLRRKLPGAGGKLDHSAISLAYDEAVRSIERAPATKRPPRAEIERIVRLAYQFEALSPTPVPRRGRLTRTVRQVDVHWTPAPLQFVYDSDELTEAGKVQAEHLFSQLQARRLPRLHLVGHTDPKGSHAYNDRLSVRRATAIKRFLVARGYPAGRITAEGRGERDVDKLRIADRHAFTQAQIHQMLRRVELNWEE